MFNSLKCSWEGSPDENARVNPANAMFCLSMIETKISDMMSAVYEKVKVECMVRDIKASSFLSDDAKLQEPSTAIKHGVPPKTTQDRELAGKVGESSKPLSLEEMRAMLE
jgi:hypothetical protein